MNAPTDFVRVVGGVRYDASKATLIAHDVYWDGNNMERHGRNTWLYRTPKGRYFSVTRTQWQGERDSLTPVTEEEARAMYERLPEHAEEYEEAFPGATVEDA